MNPGISRIMTLGIGGLLILRTSAAEPGQEPWDIGNHELARRILQDERMDDVERRGRELLKSGLNAGCVYEEVWIRDLNTSIVSLLDVAPREAVRESLMVFLHFQGEDGNIVDGYVPKDKAGAGYLYRSSPSQPLYRAHKNTVETDQEISLVQAVWQRWFRAGRGRGSRDRAR
jgi:hypothetical protein